VPLSLTADVLATARTVTGLALSGEVRERWGEESACAGMTVGALAHHTVRQVEMLVRLFPDALTDAKPISLLEHYRRAAWANTRLDDEVNTAIRDTDNQRAAGGPAELSGHATGQLVGLATALASVEDDEAVLLDWQGWSLTAGDFAVTRLMEMLVHGDDLAASVDLETPEFPEEAARRVLSLLTEVAVDRHGQTALVRTLSRPQRAPESVSAF
jgi:hypothetical protein